MFGVVVNTIAIIIGTLIGILFKKGLPDRIKTTVIQGIGLAVLLIGGKMAIETKNSIIIISSLVFGGIIGELINIENRLADLGKRMESNFNSGSDGEFTKAFVTSSLIYCVGAMAIMGALESGLRGDNQILFAKSMLDGISAIVFASSMGLGVAASALPVFIYEGMIAISAGVLQGILSTPVVNEMSATGGLLIVGIGINLLNIKEIKVGNLLPAIFMAIIFTDIFSYFHIY